MNSNGSRHYYNIHSIVKIDSQVPLIELEYFRTPNLETRADMMINVGSDVTGEGLFHLRRKIIDDDYARENKIGYTEHLGPLGSEFSIGFSSPIVVTVNSLIAKSRHVLYVNLVEPILRFLMISKGHVLLHSACIAITKQDAVLVSAPPDTGKTTTVIKCIRRGLGFLSDDMTIINPYQEALCFPKPMTISAHTFHTAVEAAGNTSTTAGVDRNINNSSSANSSNSNIGNQNTKFETPNSGTSYGQNLDESGNSSNNKGGLRIRSLVHSKGGRQFMRNLGNKNVPIFTINTIGQSIIRPPKFRIEDIVKQNVTIVPKASIDSFFFLERQSGEKVVPIPKSEALTKAVENSDDAFLFPPYKDVLRYLKIDGLDAGKLLDQEKNMIAKLMERIETNVIVSDSRSWYKTVLERSMIKVA